MGNRKEFIVRFGLVAFAVAIALSAFAFIGDVPLSYAFTAANTVSASATVTSVCYLSSLSTTSVNFGSIAAGANVPTNNQITITDNGGNAAASVLVAGGLGPSSPYNGVWTGTNNFGVANTLYSASTQATYTGTAVTNTLVASGITVPQPTVAAPSQSVSIYFGLNIPGGTAAGAYTTNVILETSC